MEKFYVFAFSWYPLPISPLHYHWLPRGAVSGCIPFRLPRATGRGPPVLYTPLRAASGLVDSFTCFQLSKETSFLTFEFSAHDNITRIHFLHATPLSFPTSSSLSSPSSPTSPLHQSHLLIVVSLPCCFCSSLSKELSFHWKVRFGQIFLGAIPSCAS